MSFLKGRRTIPAYKDFEFTATIAVSWNGCPTLISDVPLDFRFLIEGAFPDDDGWANLPKEAGIWRCQCRTQFRLDEYETSVVACWRLAGVVLEELMKNGDVISPIAVE